MKRTSDAPPDTTLVRWQLELTSEQPLPVAEHAGSMLRGVPLHHAGLPQPNVTALREGSESYARQFMACYERVCGPDRDLEKTRHGLRLGMDQNFFNEKRSRANETLINRLGPDASTPYLIQREGPKGYSRYRLPLGRNQIQWRIDDINPLRDWQD